MLTQSNGSIEEYCDMNLHMCYFIDRPWRYSSLRYLENNLVRTHWLVTVIQLVLHLPSGVLE